MRPIGRGRSVDGWLDWMDGAVSTRPHQTRSCQARPSGNVWHPLTGQDGAAFGIFLTNNFVCATCHVARRRATRRVFCGSPRVPRRRVKVNRSVVLYVLFSLLAKRHVCIYKYTGGDDLSENDPAHPQKKKRKKKTTQLALVCRCSTYV